MEGRKKKMRRMHKGNSSSEFALNMPALERRRSDVAHFTPARRLLPTACALVFALHPELMRDREGIKGSRKEGSSSHRRVTSPV